MTYKSIILPTTKNDIREAAIWYNKQRPGVGARFVSHIRTEINAIKQNPYAFPVRYDNTRTAVVKVFPFMIQFSVDRNKTIVISAVLHTSRNPFWLNNEG